MGLLLGFDRKTAVKFSFFLSVPIIASAALFEFSKLIQSGADIDISNFIITVFLLEAHLDLALKPGLFFHFLPGKPCEREGAEVILVSISGRLVPP